jgi:hypothetical protein
MRPEFSKDSIIRVWIIRGERSIQLDRAKYSSRVAVWRRLTRVVLSPALATGASSTSCQSTVGRSSLKVLFGVSR